MQTFLERVREEPDTVIECWEELVAVVGAAIELKNADDDIVGVQHDDCSKPPCSGCRHDQAMDVIEGKIYALNKKAEE